MKKLRKKEKAIKATYALVFASFLICSSFSVSADIIPNQLKQNNQIQESLIEEVGNISILSENFSAGSMPPAGWIHQITNPNGTWKIDTLRQHSVPNSASVYRGMSCFGLQDEWLITPSMNFSEYLITQPKYNDIYLRFWWYTDIYVIQHSLIHFNVSISTNGGTNWTKLWTAKDQSGFPQYEFSEKGMPIDISEYRNETDVTIGFQFFSNTTQEAIAQFFAIDDILILTDSPVNFTCDAGGPYEWYYYRQLDYIPNGVRFHGNVAEGFNPLVCQWLWDFGNNITSQIPVHTWNFYSTTGTYNITLQVKYGDLVAFDHTTVHIFLLPPPELEISLNPISFPGIQATLKNPGDYNATYVNWSMTVFLGPLKIREKTVAIDTIDSVEAHSSASLTSKYFFGCKLIRVVISATPDNLPGREKTYNALKIGPLTIAL